MRVIAAAVVACTLGTAPFQCAHDPDPNVRREDTPGDALWDLAQKFKAEHSDAAARRTLEYLVAKYPSSRFASPAREELAKMPPASAVP